MGSNLFKQILEPLPSLVQGSFVCWVLVPRILSCAHEAMAGPFIGDRLVGLARFLHHLGGLGNVRVYPRVITSIKPVDRTINTRDVAFLIRHGSIEGKRRFNVLAVRRKAESLAATPTKTSDRDFPIASRQLRDVIHNRV